MKIYEASGNAQGVMNCINSKIEGLYIGQAGYLVIIQGLYQNLPVQYSHYASVTRPDGGSGSLNANQGLISNIKFDYLQEWKASFISPFPCFRK